MIPLNRRDFLRSTLATGAGALLAGNLRADDASKLKATADSVILLWMAGGQAAPRPGT